MAGLGSTSQKEKAELCLNAALCRKPSEIPTERLPCSSTPTRGSGNPPLIHSLDGPKGPEAKSTEHLHSRAAGAILGGCRTWTKVNLGEIKGTLEVPRTSKSLAYKGLHASITSSPSSAPDSSPSTSFVQQQELEFTPEGKTLPTANCFPPPKSCSCSPPAAPGNLK